MIAVGIQAHWALDYPTEAEAEQTIAELAACTGRVAITELDVNVLPRPGNAQGADLGLRGENSREMDPYREGLPDAVLSEQAERYAMFFRLFLTHSDAIDRVTFWGVDDGRSWHNGWPIRGRTAHSLLFDRSLDPKPAFAAVVESGRRPRRAQLPLTAKPTICFPTFSNPTLLKMSVAIESPDYLDPSLPIADRVSDLLGRMTLEEKAAQMVCVWNKKNDVLLDDEGCFDEQRAKKHFGGGEGLGQVGRPGDTNGGVRPQQYAELTNAIQRFFLENTRLGIPVLFHDESLHGLMAREATNFSQPIGLAATFDTELVRRLYEMTALEARACGAHQLLSPVLDVARDPRWGRVEETFGEDPYLVGEMGLAAVRGVPGGIGGSPMAITSSAR